MNVANVFNGASFYDSQSCGKGYSHIKTHTLFYVHCYQTLVGRYVIVQMYAGNAALVVCEIEVYQKQGKVQKLSGNMVKHTQNLFNLKMYCLSPKHYIAKLFQGWGMYSVKIYICFYIIPLKSVYTNEVIYTNW